MLNWLGSLHLHNFDLPEALEPTLKEEEKKVEEEEKVKEEETGEEQDEPEAKKRRSSSLSQLHRDLQVKASSQSVGWACKWSLLGVAGSWEDGGDWRDPGSQRSLISSVPLPLPFLSFCSPFYLPLPTFLLCGFIFLPRGRRPRGF